MSAMGASRHIFHHHAVGLGSERFTLVCAMFFFFVLGLVHLITPAEANGTGRHPYATEKLVLVLCR